MKRTSGFTMVEVVTVLVLIGIISAATVSLMPRVGESEFAERLLLKSNLRYARQRSMDTEDNWSVSFSGNSYTLNQDGAAGPDFPAIGAGTHASSAGFSASGPVEFQSPHGTVANPVTITFDNGSLVTVHTTGAIQ